MCLGLVWSPSLLLHSTQYSTQIIPNLGIPNGPTDAALRH